MALHFASEIPLLRRSLTFIHVPKTGGTSFTHWVVTNNIPHDNQAMHADMGKVKSIWPDLGYCFALVRNPFDRLVSYFNYVGQNAQVRIESYHQGQELKKRFNLEQEQSILEIYRQGFYYWLRQEFHEERTALTLDKTFMNWRRPQVSWTKGCDRIIKLENFPQEFEWLQHYFRCYEPLPHVNASRRGYYRDYYNPESRAWAYKMFEKDLDELQYTF